MGVGTIKDSGVCVCACAGRGRGGATGSGLWCWARINFKLVAFQIICAICFQAKYSNVSNC